MQMFAGNWRRFMNLSANINGPISGAPPSPLPLSVPTSGFIPLRRNTDVPTRLTEIVVVALRSTVCVLCLVFVGCFGDQPDATPSALPGLTWKTEFSRELKIDADGDVSGNPQSMATPPLLGKTETLTNSIGMRFAQIPAGEFLMGAPETDLQALDHERPQHRVQISKPFFLGVYEVTQDQYLEVVSENPSHFRNADDTSDHVSQRAGTALPVDSVSWDDAVTFCRRLAELPEEKQAGRTYRIPTDAEWEYACRAGSTTLFAFGGSLSSRQANFNGERPYGGAENGPNLQRTAPVGSYPPNAFGLYDMHGNLWEWCADWFRESYYGRSLRVDPTGPESGRYRVLHGGCWFSFGVGCRSTGRIMFEPLLRNNGNGFRVVCER